MISKEICEVCWRERSGMNSARLSADGYCPAIHGMMLYAFTDTPPIPKKCLKLFAQTIATGLSKEGGDA